MIAVAIFGIIPAIIADEAAAAFESLDVEEEEEVVEVEVEANRTAERSPLGRLWLFLEGQVRVRVRSGAPLVGCGYF